MYLLDAFMSLGPMRGHSFPSPGNALGEIATSPLFVVGDGPGGVAEVFFFRGRKFLNRFLSIAFMNASCGLTTPC